MIDKLDKLDKIKRWKSFHKIKNVDPLGWDKFKRDSLTDRQRLAGCPAEANMFLCENSFLRILKYEYRNTNKDEQSF